MVIYFKDGLSVLLLRGNGVDFTVQKPTENQYKIGNNKEEKWKKYNFSNLRKLEPEMFAMFSL